MPRRTLAWMACLVLTIVSWSQEQESKRVSAAPRHVIPFTLTEDQIISVRAVLNDTETVELMLHTAVDSVSLTKAAVARLESLTFDHSANIESWGGRSSARYSSKNSLRIGDLSWSDVAITEDEHSGRLTDGKFGCNLFSDAVVEIDYEACEVRLYDELPSTSGYAKLAIEVEHGSFFVEGRLRVGDVELSNRFLVHSGYNGSLLLDDEFARAHDLGSRLEVVGERELRDSMGNVLKTSRIVVPSLSFGSVALAGVQAEVFEGAIDRQKMSVVGCHVLSRFHILLDAKRQYLYLKPREPESASPR